MTNQSVYSSHVDHVSHDPATNELRVRWKDGKTSVYAGVSADTARTVANAPSVGTAIRTMIKPHHEHRYDR